MGQFYNALFNYQNVISCNIRLIYLRRSDHFSIFRTVYLSAALAYLREHYICGSRGRGWQINTSLRFVDTHS